MKTISVKSQRIILLLIFILALVIRFLYFPDNVNFSYDQARDSFATLDILKGDLKIIGPPTTISDKIFHGVLFYYLLAPVYFLSGGSPEVGAAVLRIVNALGIFLVFYIGKIIFNKEVGLLSAFLFAISYEQSQYSLFFGHPAMGVISVLIYYLGLALVIFKKEARGFFIALVGLGLTIQFEDVNVLLVFSLIAFLLIFYKNFKTLSKKEIILSILGFLLSVGSFLLVEIKFQFQMAKTAVMIISNLHKSPTGLNQLGVVFKRFINDNFIAGDVMTSLLAVVIPLLLVNLIRKKPIRDKALFLTIWFLAGLLPQIFAKSFSYYYSPGASVSLILLSAFLILKIFRQYKLPAVFIILVIIFSNANLINKQNELGVNTDILIQPGMILKNQKTAIDYIYQQAGTDAFSINGLTVPLNVNTTWSYLFEWYGFGKYGYLPVWGGETASGFPGKLKIETARSKLPRARFTIIEPTNGIDEYHKNKFFEEENIFSKVTEEKTFGTIRVQRRQPY